MTDVIDLDDDRCLDPSISGGKAARLALARQHGLPALPGVVVTAAASRDALRAGAKALLERGSGGARLVVMSTALRPELAAAVDAAAESLPTPLIARSSSLLERDTRWSGAFTSVTGLEKGDLCTGLRACWASVFRPDTLERLEEESIDPADTHFAVLFQPELDPEFGGTARLRVDGIAEVSAVRGSPAPLLAGWASGVTAGVHPDGSVDGDECQGLAGPDVVRGIAELVRNTSRSIGDTSIEWAWNSGRAVLLQSHRQVDSPVASARVAVDPSLSTAFALEVACLVHEFGDAVAEELILPWAFADPRGSQLRTLDARSMPLTAARVAAHALAARAWGLDPERVLDEVGRVLQTLRGHAPGEALSRLQRLFPVVSDDTAALVATAARHAPVPSRGPGRWEPFIHAVIMAQRDVVQGSSAGIGIGAGQLVPVTDPHDPPILPSRSIILARQPVQALAPLLWQAAGIVTTSGSVGAHLFEVAHSLGVPAVIVPPAAIPALGDTAAAARSETYLAAVDGNSGTLALAPMRDRVLHNAAQP